MIKSAADIFPSPDLLALLRRQVNENNPIYLVGGAVRDLLMQQPGHDLDFVVTRDAVQTARRFADAIGAVFYIMDVGREIARVIHEDEQGQQWFFDFSTLRGNDIHEDLEARDFTINAIAIDLNHLSATIDPLRGAQAIKERRLEMCRSDAFASDPLRVIRAIRLSADLGFNITKDTLLQLKAAIPALRGVSIERQRDELFHILESRQALAGLRAGFALGVFDALLPEVAALKGEAQGAPHVHDVFDHTLALLDALIKLYSLLVEPYVEEKGSSLIHGLAVLELGRFRPDLNRHFSRRINPNRSLLGLLMLTGLLHDSAKPSARTVDALGRIHFYGHDRLGAELARQRCQDLALSAQESDRVALLVDHHMRIHHLTKDEHEISRRSIYRYYRDLGDAGVDLVLLSLADKLAAYGVTITPDHWQKGLHTCRQLLDAWFEADRPIVQPGRLLNGSDLIDEFELQPGPIIGEMLERIREEQAAGGLSTREEALEFARKHIIHYRRGI